MPIIKLRFRTAFFIAGAFTLLLTAYFAISYFSIKSSLTSRSDEEVRQLLHSVGNGVRVDDSTFTLSSLTEHFGSTGEAIVGFKIFIDKNNTAFPAEGPSILTGFLDSGQYSTDQSPSNYQFRSTTIRIFSEHRLGFTIIAAINTIAFDEVFEAMLGTYFILLLSGVIISLILAVMVADLALKPLRLLMKSAILIKSNPSSKKLTLPSNTSTKETNDLAEIINEIIDERDTNIKRLKNFTADAAHELRTPLTILKGELEVDLRIKDLPASDRQALESNLEEVQRLIIIVEDLMLLARAENTLQKEEYSGWGLNEFLEQIIQRLLPLSESKSIDLHLKSMPKNELLYVHRDSVEKIIYNIILNAIQYTPAGRNIHITTQLTNDNSIAIEIRDEGIGISAEDLPHIFDRFWRADKSRSRESGGVGLGLSIAKTFADATDIRLTVNSILTKGTTIVVLIPQRSLSQE